MEVSWFICSQEVLEVQHSIFSDERYIVIFVLSSSFMPSLMITLLIYTTAYPYLVGGPLTPFNVSDADQCRTEWWKSLLLINNFSDLSSTV